MRRTVGLGDHGRLCLFYYRCVSRPLSRRFRRLLECVLQSHASQKLALVSLSTAQWLGTAACASHANKPGEKANHHVSPASSIRLRVALDNVREFREYVI